MKIGMITYHNALNYGAVFQCHALYDYLCDMQNVDSVEVINYENKIVEDKDNIVKLLMRTRSISRKAKLFISIPQLLKKKYGFNSYKKSMNISKRYCSDSIYGIRNEYDAFIIGSDQLWNFKMNGYDTTYYLPFLERKNKIVSYGTSIGASDIPERIIQEFTESLEQFSAISVREEIAKEIINGLLPNKPVSVVLDPVFLMGRKYWMKYGKAKKRDQIVYYFFNSENINQAQNILNDIGANDYRIKKICGGISLKDYLSPQIGVCMSASPEQLLRIISSSKLALTDSFHCTAMSIIYHTPFVVFLSGNPGSDARIVQLLHVCGLESRIYFEKFKLNEIDWDDVDKRIEECSIYSRDYLTKAISEIR